MAGTYLSPLAQKCKSVPWRWLAFGLIAFPAWILLCAATVRAQEVPCFDKFSPQEWTKKTKEIELWHGVTASGLLVRLFANEQGSFTVIMDMGQGRVCIPVVGEDGEFAVPETLGTPS